MSKCKHCEEDITWIDGRPFSLQSHFKVCRPNGQRVKPEAKKNELGLSADMTEEQVRAQLAANREAMQQNGKVG